MKSCANCKDANYCYYPGGAPSNHSCSNWGPGNSYNTHIYDQYLHEVPIVSNSKLTELDLWKWCR